MHLFIYLRGTHERKRSVSIDLGTWLRYCRDHCGFSLPVCSEDGIPHSHDRVCRSARCRYRRHSMLEKPVGGHDGQQHLPLPHNVRERKSVSFFRIRTVGTRYKGNEAHLSKRNVLHCRLDRSFRTLHRGNGPRYGRSLSRSAIARKSPCDPCAASMCHGLPSTAAARFVL